MIFRVLEPVPGSEEAGSEEPGSEEAEYVVRLQQMSEVLSESQHITAKFETIERVLKSKRPIAKAERIYMAKMAKHVKDKVFQGFNVIAEGISAIREAIKDGSLLPVTKGFKALQENFNDLLSEISQASVLHDLASKCYSKGLITPAEKRAAFATGDPTTQANNFLDLICSRIKRDAKKYKLFLGVLKTEAAYENMVVLAGGG